MSKNSRALWALPPPRSATRRVQETEDLDGAGVTFVHDRWERPGTESSGGYGTTCVLEGGDLLEKVGGAGLDCKPPEAGISWSHDRGS